MADGAKPKYSGQERWERDLETVIQVTSKPRVGERTTISGREVRFDRTMLLDLLRRREQGTESDGIRSRSYDGAGGGSGDLTLTEAAALRGLPEADDDRPDDWRRHVQPDPIGVAIEAALDSLAEMARNARLFEKKLNVILNAGDAVTDREGRARSVGQCQACGRDVPGTEADRLRSGYCDRVAGVPWSGCYRLWAGQGRPDRLAFERWVQAEMGARAEDALPAHGFYEVADLDELQAKGTLPKPQAKTA